MIGGIQYVGCPQCGHPIPYFDDITHYVHACGATIPRLPAYTPEYEDSGKPDGTIFLSSENPTRVTVTRSTNKPRSETDSGLVAHLTSY